MSPHLDRSEIDPELCLPAAAVVALIPEVRPEPVLRALRFLVFSACLDGSAGQLKISHDDLEGVIAVAAQSGQQVITPKGARLLKCMFEAGLIRQHRAGSSRDLSALETYIASEPELLRQTAQRRSHDALRGQLDPSGRS